MAESGTSKTTQLGAAPGIARSTCAHPSVVVSHTCVPANTHGIALLGVLSARVAQSVHVARRWCAVCQPMRAKGRKGTVVAVLVPYDVLLQFLVDVVAVGELHSSWSWLSSAKKATQWRDARWGARRAYSRPPSRHQHTTKAKEKRKGCQRRGCRGRALAVLGRGCRWRRAVELWQEARWGAKCRALSRPGSRHQPANESPGAGGAVQIPANKVSTMRL